MTLQHDATHPAFDEFVRAHSGSLIRAAYLLTGDRHHAEDLVQSVLVRVVQRWHTIDEPGAYARRVLYTQSVSWWRRRGRVVETLTPDVPDRPEAAREPELAFALREALGRLTARQRAVLVLRFYEDRSESEAAELLGCRLGTVKSQTRHALRRLRQLAPELVEFVTDGGRQTEVTTR